MATARCPVCAAEFPEEDAEALGAFKVVRGGKTHWFDSATCVEEFETRGR